MLSNSLFIMKKIIITGSNGRIGTLLKERLAEYEVTALDLPDGDVRNVEILKNAFPDHDVVIHLAWDNTEGWYANDSAKRENISLDNKLMAHNIYKTALSAGVPRVIMASSVHADWFYNWDKGGLLSAEKMPWPDSPYGASKIYTEALGRYYATKGLEVVCIRFGGVREEARAYDENPYERAVWFSYRDCANLVKCAIEANSVLYNFAVV